MRFIDFQLSRVGSPVLDLSYYLYACATRLVLHQFDFLLQVYHSSFSEMLENFQINVEDVLTFKELQAQWRVYGKFGLMLCPLVTKLVLCEAEEVIDFTDAAETGNLENALDFRLKNVDLYEERIRDVFEHWANNFF